MDTRGSRAAGWLLLCAFCALEGVSVAVAAVWRLVHGDVVLAVLMPIDLLLCYWVGVGAWRRSARSLEPR